MTDELTSNEDVIRAGYDDRAELYAIDAAAAPSTDERLCAVCGHGRYEDPRHGTCNHQIGGSPVFCSCHRFSPEAAPSTDEGEARWVRDKIVGKYAIWKYNSAEHWVHLSLEAAIRAPLEESRQRLTDAFCEVWLREVGRADAAEERIRELEADIQAMSDGPTHEEWWGMNRALQSEVERLREALRESRESAESVEVWLRPLLCDEDVTICSHPICNAWIAAGLTASNLRALATPPSSTEGTKES